MTEYTAKYALPRKEGSDEVAVASDLNSLAVASDIVMSGIEARANNRLGPLEYYIQSNGGIKGDKGDAGPAGPPAATSDLITRLLSPATPPMPAEFEFGVPFLVERLVGGTYGTSITAEDFHIPGPGRTYYVNGTTGDNANDGFTPETAFATPYYAWTRTDVAEIVVAGGTYHRSDSIHRFNKSLSVRAAPGEKVRMSTCDVYEASSWALESGTTWQVGRSAVADVLDQTDLDADGDMRPLDKMPSIAEVNSTPGSWYTAGGIVYVNTHDGRRPGTDVWLSMGVNSLYYDSALTEDISVYLEGIEFIGGTTANFTPPGPLSYLSAKDCQFNLTNSTNGLSVLGVRRVILERCKANGNVLDGFNYHDYNGNTGEVVEIDCTGEKNGRASGSNNGSTAHDNYKVVRVSGKYRKNTGANVADPLPASSFNVGVAGSNSTGYGQDFYGGNMWLNSCYATGSPTSVAAEAGGVVRVRDSVLTGTSDGNVVSY